MMNFPGTPHGPAFAPVLQAAMPVGAVIAFAGPLGDPAGQGLDNAGGLQACGWVPCDGRALACSQYPELFAVVGYAYGGADGLFHIPDYRGGPLRATGQPAAGQPAAGLEGVTYIIRFTSGFLQPPPLAAAAALGKDPMEQDAPPCVQEAVAAAPAGTGPARVEMAANLPDVPVMEDQVQCLTWHATPEHGFEFRLIYGPDGRFKSLECAMHSRQMIHALNDVYPLPLSLKCLDAAGRNVEIRMTLAPNHGPWIYRVQCQIDVPGFQFEGTAFVFSDEINGPAPNTIW